jgi:hypothetical protein
VEAANATDPARRAVAMFVDNVDNEKCREFISGTEWAKPMVGRCRLTLSRPVLKAPMVSALEADI